MHATETDVATQHKAAGKAEVRRTQLNNCSSTAMEACLGKCQIKFPECVKVNVMKLEENYEM